MILIWKSPVSCTEIFFHKFVMCLCDIHPNIGKRGSVQLHRQCGFPLSALPSSHGPNTSILGHCRCERKCVWLFVSVCQPGDELMPCAGSTPLSLPETAGIDTSPSVTLKRISGVRWWMDVVIRPAWILTIRLTGLFGDLKHQSKLWICNISIL